MPCCFFFFSPSPGNPSNVRPVSQAKYQEIKCEFTDWVDSSLVCRGSQFTHLVRCLAIIDEGLVGEEKHYDYMRYMMMMQSQKAINFWDRLKELKKSEKKNIKAVALWWTCVECIAYGLITAWMHYIIGLDWSMRGLTLGNKCLSECGMIVIDLSPMWSFSSHFQLRN